MYSAIEFYENTKIDNKVESIYLVNTDKEEYKKLNMPDIDIYLDDIICTIDITKYIIIAHKHGIIVYDSINYSLLYNYNVKTLIEEYKILESNILYNFINAIKKGKFSLYVNEITFKSSGIDDVLYVLTIGQDKVEFVVCPMENIPLIKLPEKEKLNSIVIYENIVKTRKIYKYNIIKY